MAISFALIFGLMAHPRVDDALIEAAGRTIAGEGMPENVPAFEFLPFAAGKRLLELVIELGRV